MFQGNLLCDDTTEKEIFIHFLEWEHQVELPKLISLILIESIKSGDIWLLPRCFGNHKTTQIVFVFFVLTH